MLVWGLIVCVGIVCQNTAEAFDILGHLPKNLQDTLQTVHQWKYFDYDFDSEGARQAAIRSGAYNRSNILPIDVDYWHGKYFVTTVRAEGVPSSLNVVSDKTGPGGPLLAPYPNWSWANAEDCSGITGVYRVAIDECDRLWVLDTGLVRDTPKCPAQLLVFDLNTSTLLKRLTIPDEVAKNSTTGLGRLVTPVVQTSGHNCQTTYVYIADTRGNALIIYDGSSFRRLASGAFDYDPQALRITIMGQSFDLPDGVLGMALSHVTHNLYLGPLAGFNLDYVNIEDLRNLPGDQVEYKEYKNILTSQNTAKAISAHGTLFYGLVNNNAIGCWNEFNELNRENIDVAAQNSETLQCPSGLKIKEYDGEEQLLVMSNRFQKFVSGTMDFTDFNYRILTGNVEDLISGTRCHPHLFP